MEPGKAAEAVPALPVRAKAQEIIAQNHYRPLDPGGSSAPRRGFSENRARDDPAIRRLESRAAEVLRRWRVFSTRSTRVPDDEPDEPSVAGDRLARSLRGSPFASDWVSMNSVVLRSAAGMGQTSPVSVAGRARARRSPLPGFGLSLALR
jgi:hypothetical protein